MIADKIEALLASRGCDADAVREELSVAEIEAGISAKSNRRNPVPHDREKYRWRNLVDRLFNKLKNWRRIATRYNKTQGSYRLRQSRRSPAVKTVCPRNLVVRADQQWLCRCASSTPE